MASKKDRKTAAALIDLEYGPQFAQVRDLWGQTRSQYQRDLSGARQIAKGIQTQAAASEPKIKDIYSTGRADLRTSAGFVDKALDQIPQTQTGLSGLLSQAMARERGAARDRNTSARTGALTELTNRASQAEAGKALAYKAAKGNLLSQRKDLTTRLADLTGQSQSKMTALLGQMSDERTKTREASRAAGGKTITSGAYAGYTQAELDAMSTEEKRKIATKKDAKSKSSKGRATNDQIRQLSDDFNAALNQAKKLTDNPRPTTAAVMIAGKSPVKGDKTGTTIKKSGQLPTTLALDIAYDGHISRANAKRLHALGYSVADLTGATSYQDWIKSPAGRAWQAKQNAAKKTAPKPKLAPAFTTPFHLG